MILTVTRQWIIFLLFKPSARSRMLSALPSAPSPLLTSSCTATFQRWWNHTRTHTHESRCHASCSLTIFVNNHIQPFLPTLYLTYQQTRSGKIMRRILRKIAAGEEDSVGDISTLADPSVSYPLLKSTPFVLFIYRDMTCLASLL